jgi:DNA invertase Pin-like site-specific DNA recombinase
MQDASEQGAQVPAVLYAAKSTEDLRGSIATQLADCQERAEREDWNVLETFSDENCSAYHGNRGPGLANARELAAKNAPCVLLVQHSDRLARGGGNAPDAAEHLAEIMFWAHRSGVELRSVQDDDSLRNPLLTFIMGERNFEDSRRKAAATTAGKRRAAERGEWQGRVPDGYLIERTPSGVDVARRVVIDTERQAIYELIWGLALEGATVNATVRELGARGYMTEPRYGVKRERPAQPKPFNESRVGKTLRNDFYAGRLTYGGVSRMGHWPAYVEPDDFDRLCRERAARRRHPGNPIGRPRGGLLARLARCGECGSPAVHHSGDARKDGTRRRRYICETHKRRPGVVDGCAALPYDADLAERTVLGGLDELLCRADAWSKALVANRRAQRTRLEAGADTAAREIADCEAAIDKLVDDYGAAVAAGDEQRCKLAKKALERHEGAIERARRLQRAATDALAAEIEEHEQDTGAAIARLMETLGGSARAAKGDVKTLNGILREHFESMTLSVEDGQLSITPVLNAETVQRLLDENRAATRRTDSEPVSWRHWSYDRDPADPEHWALQPVAAKLATSK